MSYHSLVFQFDIPKNFVSSHKDTKSNLIGNLIHIMVISSLDIWKFGRNGVYVGTSRGLKVALHTNECTKRSGRKKIWIAAQSGFHIILPT
jgi:hypothetical protein